MKLKFVATPRDVMIFAVFALFLLYVVCIGVLNIPVLAATGTFYGLNPIEAFSPDYIYYTLIIYFIALGGLIMSVNSYFFEFLSFLLIPLTPRLKILIYWNRKINDPKIPVFAISSP